MLWFTVNTVLSLFHDQREENSVPASFRAFRRDRTHHVQIFSFPLAIEV